MRRLIGRLILILYVSQIIFIIIKCLQEVKSMSKKYVYMFSEGNASMRNLLGGKGANLK